MIDWLNTLPIHRYDEIVRDKIENVEEETKPLNEENNDKKNEDVVEDNS